MSTPSVTILKNLVLNWESNQMEEETIATFYRHYDGYPSCHAIDIANSLVVASRTKPEHIDFSGASVERDILNNRNWCQLGFDGDYGLFEDACTDARLFGHGIG